MHKLAITRSNGRHPLEKWTGRFAILPYQRDHEARAGAFERILASLYEAMLDDTCWTATRAHRTPSGTAGSTPPYIVKPKAGLRPRVW